MLKLQKGFRLWMLWLVCCASGNALAIEYHGYIRSGIGAGQWGTDQQKFEVPGAPATFRLGNETDTYVENSIGQDFSKTSDTDPYFRAQLLFALATAGHRDWEGTSASFSTTPATGAALTIALREAFAEGKNICGAGTNLWIGKRYYMREDLHILDMYLLDNAGPGAGLEGIGLGPLKLHVAVTRNIPELPVPTKGSLSPQTNLDLRLSAIEIASGAKLTPVVIYGSTTERNDLGNKEWEALSGIHAALFYRQELGTELSNQFSVQYGTGIFGGIASNGVTTLNAWGGWDSNAVVKGDSDTLKAREKSSTLRIAEQLTLGKSDSFSGQVVAVYETTDFGGGTTTINTVAEKTPARSKLLAGVRPMYHFSKNAALALEVGQISVSKQKTGSAAAGSEEFSDLSMTKVTIAPVLQPDLGFWSRPQLRFFATYATWNDDVMNSGVYTDKAGWSVGSQFESWW